MRVLTFLHSFEPGGVERVALRLCRTWRAKGIDTHLVMGRADGAMRDEAGVPYELLSGGRVPTAAWETLWMILTLPRVIRRVRPDVLFCAGNSYSVVSVAMKLILGRRCPPIVAKVSNDLARRDMPRVWRTVYHLWLRIQARSIDRFVGMAEPMRAEIATHMRIDPARVAIIDDPSLSAADLKRFANPRPVSDIGRRFLAAGRLSSQKNFARLLDAFALIARPDDTLTILGEGPERAALERQAVRLGIADRVALPGYATDLHRWLGESDVFVLSSAFEGVPAVIVEALASGIAIVATDCSVSMADMLDGGRLGTLVPVGDTAALARAMDVAILNDPTIVDQRRAMAARFTVERAASAYLAEFSGLIAQR